MANVPVISSGHFRSTGQTLQTVSSGALRDNSTLVGIAFVETIGWRSRVSSLLEADRTKIKHERIVFFFEFVSATNACACSSVSCCVLMLCGDSHCCQMMDGKVVTQQVQIRDACPDSSHVGRCRCFKMVRQRNQEAWVHRGCGSGGGGGRGGMQIANAKKYPKGRVVWSGRGRFPEYPNFWKPDSK